MGDYDDLSSDSAPPWDEAPMDDKPRARREHRRHLRRGAGAAAASGETRPVVQGPKPPRDRRRLYRAGAQVPAAHLRGP
ncbi:hypothetical protein ACRAWD_24280 [Caulobacter segnis]